MLLLFNIILICVRKSSIFELAVNVLVKRSSKFCLKNGRQNLSKIKEVEFQSDCFTIPRISD